MPRVVAICSAASGRGERKSKAWIWATVRLIPQRVPISPQWRMNFCATGESFFISILLFLSKQKLVKMRREVKENVAPRTTEFPERAEGDSHCRRNKESHPRHQDRLGYEPRTNAIPPHHPFFPHGLLVQI